MQCDHKYMMWGIIPIVFSAQGTWRVAVRNRVLNAFFVSVAALLLSTNRAVERLLGDIELQVPLVPTERALVCRTLRALHLHPGHDIETT